MFASFQRIKSIVLRNLYVEKRSITRITDFFYFPVIDITLWGLTSMWIQSTNTVNASQLATALLTNLVLWQVFTRSSYEISLGTVEELWNRSIVNLFATPLTVHEWLAALLFSGLFKSVAVFIFGASVVKILYGISVVLPFSILAPAFILIVMSGWCNGILGSALPMKWGERVSSIPWILSWLFAPFSGVFYPLETLPSWMKIIGNAIPMTHILSYTREYLLTQTTHTEKLITALLLCCLYGCLALLLFFTLFKQSKKQGLARLER